MSRKDLSLAMKWASTCMEGKSVKSEEAVLLFIVDLLTAAKFTRAYNKDTIYARVDYLPIYKIEPKYYCAEKIPN